MSEFGYAGEILRIDLSRRNIGKLVTADYADRFLGGRGIAAKIYWDETSPETKAFDPENCLICMTGPLAGFTRFAGCRWQICGKSPEMEPESFSYANLGGSWGAWLKYAGYDGLAVTGKADQPVYIYIANGRVEIRDASHLWGKTTTETQDSLRAELGKDVRVLCIGPAGENLVSFATVLAADNASGSSGFGSVMGSKMLKAVVVKVDEKRRPVAADPDMLKSLADQVYQLRTKNYENYGHVTYERTRRTACYGCISGCDRQEYEDENGKTYKHFCQASFMYIEPAIKYYGDDGGAKVSMLAGRLADQYGLDTAVIQPLIDWLGKCHEACILNDKETGLPLSRIGSSEFIETLVRKISFREGFGDILARGTLKAADYVGKGSHKFIGPGIGTRAGATSDYDPRFMIVNGLIYATEPRRAIQLLHATALPIARWINWLEGYDDAFLSTEILQDIAETFWGSVDAGDFSTYAGKALAAKRIQDFGYIKESLIICDLAWPIYQVQHFDENIGFYTMESHIVSAITGRNLDEEELNRIGERIFNLQRAILLRQGWGGREGDNLLDYLYHEPLELLFFDPECIAPGKDGKQISKKGAVVERERFEKLKDEYYALRGWDVETGFQTRIKLQDLDLDDIASDLEKRRLLR